MNTVKTTWLIRTHNTIGLESFFGLLVILFLPPAVYTCTCGDKGMVSIQDNCAEYDQALLDTKTEDTAQVVCQRYNEMFQCIAQHAPQCLPNSTQPYEMYTQTPWDCHFSKNVTTYQVGTGDCVEQLTEPPEQTTISCAETSNKPTHSKTKGDPTNGCTGYRSMSLVSLLVTAMDILFLYT